MLVCPGFVLSKQFSPFKTFKAVALIFTLSLVTVAAAQDAMSAGRMRAGYRGREVAPDTSLNAQAAGAKAHMRNSAASSATVKAEKPVFSIVPGTYSSEQTLTITDATPGATIYYTTNGLNAGPCCSTPYTAPITISKSEVVVAMAAATGYADSDSAVGTFLISSSPTSLLYTVAGSGTMGFGGMGGSATFALLYSPVAAVADSAGNV